MRAYRLLQLVQQTSRGFEAGAALRGTVAAAWGSSAGGGASGGSAAHRAPRSLVAVPRALYHKRNPFDFRVVREDGEELPGVKNLELSIDEMDEQRCGADTGEEASWSQTCGNGDAEMCWRPMPCPGLAWIALRVLSCRKKVERGVEDAKAAALKLLGARAHSRKEVRGGRQRACPPAWRCPVQPLLLLFVALAQLLAPCHTPPLHAPTPHHLVRCACHPAAQSEAA